MRRCLGARSFSLLHKENKKCIQILIWKSLETSRSCGSSGSIVSDYGLDDRGSIPDRGREFFFQPLRPDRL
jgi:hypothetical protein